MEQNTEWQKTKHGLYKQFVFKDFAEAFSFMQRVARVAEEYQHHPRWQNEWNVVDIWLSTHDAGMQVTDLDKRLANTIDTLFEKPPKTEIENTDVQNATSLTEVKLFTDGGSRGNPGPSASGYAVLNMSDEVIVQAGEYIGITTNNQAEYQALKLGLEAAFTRGARTVHVYMDSMLVVNQMNKVFKVSNRDLWPIHDSIMQLVRKFEKITFTHVPRELNQIADREVNKALDAATRK